MGCFLPAVLSENIVFHKVNEMLFYRIGVLRGVGEINAAYCQRIAQLIENYPVRWRKLGRYGGTMEGDHLSFQNLLIGGHHLSQV